MIQNAAVLSESLQPVFVAHFRLDIEDNYRLITVYGVYEFQTLLFYMLFQL